MHGDRSGFGATSSAPFHAPGAMGIVQIGLRDASGGIRLTIPPCIRVDWASWVLLHVDHQKLRPQAGLLFRYEWRDVTPRDARLADRTTDPNDACDGYRSFTGTLWYVIRETKSTRWAERSGAAPGTRRWRQWLREAEENARAGNRRWAAVRRRDHIFADDESDAIR
ncbi:hypothetical protein J7T55_003631 [Diaporthe amygdali]|uniref:uncharacterized protein n=1 Tax=Phomopsis amygdali TaxID=1214568 RepID=UPI0022FEFDC2|nr:uncharacterized protein J7T55_003631 [Diaporthe amygdali]KAJ0117221.1 hypothetical protein J7T55_003631 [Diaporthe amygdali]